MGETRSNSSQSEASSSPRLLPGLRAGFPQTCKLKQSLSFYNSFSFGLLGAIILVFSCILLYVYCNNSGVIPDPVSWAFHRCLFSRAERSIALAGNAGERGPHETGSSWITAGSFFMWFPHRHCGLSVHQCSRGGLI